MPCVDIYYLYTPSIQKKKMKKKNGISICLTRFETIFNCKVFTNLGHCCVAQIIIPLFILFYL